MNKAIIAILAITIIETLAIFRGIDGALLAAAIAAIAGLGGYQIGKRKLKK